ncbi:MULTISPECIES: NAD(P)-dependent oxidoreductase [Rhodococcus]|uniref:NAD(P)-dependent oxidoreductase n=1 Tax=Rhodococcus oxybenzonivorans TaxID=1990687 RepID=A0AAE4UYK1_9NOCA|nr:MULTISPECIES: NAD(P)-dependent oxidoreductase [Rhodococcus]MDV7241730.1 NAD(P)-dependent oxidoreductase [Rhodococcus oxybenzonivorans]MDV7264659.1 NAD(P)-dependent oxidoreductase [Rhodococcus oxybenzonivorans]MDV7273736.1 NAD(P)-dependent oxidoreductase [Rhodococcus oxybenzonivorans]MDV7334012.1 NAD(P)-dependent oxidoreductase [Rhodococcus oxybenzonivorans]MDV7343431.1 NAD(P)-dependent oxidoreductase [Rhodococcus oxybenzonivorans]
MLIGFAGLGRMGRPMAANLARAGHTILAYDPGPNTGAPEGVTVVGSAAELTEAPVTISMLPDGATTRALVVEGLTSAAEGHLHVVMGTVGPELVREMAGAERMDIIDAPVSGSVSMAETATITTMVGGTAEQFERIRPVLAAMTSAQFHTGPAGSGSVAKLAVNAVLAALSQGIAEGLLIAEAGEIDLKVFYDVLRNSAAGAPYVGYKEQAFLSPGSAGVAAPVSLIRKDLGLALDLAHRQQLSLPGAEAAYMVLSEATDAGLGDEDMAQVLAALRMRNTLPIS